MATRFPRTKAGREREQQEFFTNPKSDFRIRSAALTHINDRQFLVEMLPVERDEVISKAIVQRIRYLRGLEEEKARAWAKSHPRLDGLLRTVATAAGKLSGMVDAATTPEIQRPDW